MNKDPMPLDKLPEYLKTHKNSGSAPVVRMGVIVPEKKSNWFLHTSAFLLLFSMGIMTYNFIQMPHEIIVVVDYNKDINSLQSIIKDSDAELLRVIEKEGNIYQLSVTTRKSKKEFLESLKNKNIKAK